MPASRDVTVLIPTYNEAETIGTVISDFRERGFQSILVVDGESTDGTDEVATQHGADVVYQSGSGKGQAVREAVRDYIDTQFVLMLDGDATYRAEDADSMLKPLREGDAEHVVGNRFADMRDGAMTRFNKIGNKIVNRGFSFVHGDSFVDILSGYRAFTTKSFLSMSLAADGFGLETEMAVECAKRNIPTVVVPVTYHRRPSGSNTNLRPIRDGGIIFLELFRRAKTNNPLFYFGSVGGLSTLTGLVIATYVAAEWIIAGISHEVLAIVAAAGILFGVQLLMFGVLADLIYTLHRETLQRVDKMEISHTESTQAHLSDDSGEPNRVVSTTQRAEEATQRQTREPDS